MKRVIIPIFICTISVLFIFFRLYRINESLFFFNDMGRDLLVILNSITSHRLILLGPQTSALPINQSPLYFYLILPFFLFTNRSPLSAIYLLITIYLLSFTTCLLLSRKNPHLTRTTILTFFLISIHPQYILQSRFVWNPSLVTPFILVAVTSFYILQKKPTTKILHIFSASLACSVSPSYSTAPIIVSFFLYQLLFNKRRFPSLLLTSCFYLALFNLTVIAQIVRRLFVTGVLFTPDQVYQIGSSFIQRATDLSRYITSTDSWWNLAITALILVLNLFILITRRTGLSHLLSFIFLSICLMTLISPFNIQAHYIFAITTTLFMFISSLPKTISVPIIIILSSFYLSTTNFSRYFEKAPRSYIQMNDCFHSFCSTFKDPIYVSVQSDLYPYHYGPEHRYLMRLNNCQVVDIEDGNSQANYMAVVLDSSTFSIDTKFYELELFGEHELLSYHSCTSNFGIQVLRKTSTPIP